MLKRYKIKKLISTFIILSFVGLVYAGVHDNGDGQVSCDHGCVVSPSWFGSIKVCDKGTNACVHFWRTIHIVEK